jgi:hypothetical protein
MSDAPAAGGRAAVISSSQPPARPQHRQCPTLACDAATSINKRHAQPRTHARARARPPPPRTPRPKQPERLDDVAGLHVAPGRRRVATVAAVGQQTPLRPLHPRSWAGGNVLCCLPARRAARHQGSAAMGAWRHARAGGNAGSCLLRPIEPHAATPEFARTIFQKYLHQNNKGCKSRGWTFRVRPRVWLCVPHSLGCCECVAWHSGSGSRGSGCAFPTAWVVASVWLGIQGRGLEGLAVRSPQPGLL